MFCEISKEIVMEEKKNYINKLNLKLIDDDTETGGVSFHGETLLDFLQDYERSIDSYTDKEVNEALIECGILPLDNELYSTGEEQTDIGVSCKFAREVEGHSIYCMNKKEPYRKCPYRMTGEFVKCEYYEPKNK